MTKMRDAFQRVAGKPGTSKRVDGKQAQSLEVKPPPAILDRLYAEAKRRGAKIHTQATDPNRSKDKGPEPDGP